MDLVKELADAQAEWDAARAAADEANARKAAAKTRISKALTARAALGKLSDAELAAIGFDVVDGQVVQEVPD